MPRETRIEKMIRYVNQLKLGTSKEKITKDERIGNLVCFSYDYEGQNQRIFSYS